MVALVQTGTGKTARHLISVIQKIDANNRNTQALILSPTRELCFRLETKKTTEIRKKGINVVEFTEERT
jgi:ATP-dependent RNA helicase DeaD